MEVIYADSSTSTFHEGGGAFHDGPTAIARLQLITARSALSLYLKTNGAVQLTANGHRMAVINVIEPLSGKQFSTASGKVTMKSCREAWAECERLIADIESGAVVYEED
jgi:hypothetical protein